MKYFFSLIFLLFIGVYTEAKEVVFPSLDAVINKLYDNYIVPESTDERILDFAKKPAGWFLQWKDQTKFPSVVVEEELLWSAGTKKFVGLEKLAKGKTTKSAEQKNRLVSYGDRYNFSRCAFYGYTGWDKDVIAAFGKTAKLSDTLLEGLGRAYSSYAYAFIDHSYGYPYPIAVSDPAVKQDSFIFYTRLDIATFDRLRKQNPDYIMLAGNSNTKYCGEVMSFYDHLQLSGNEKLASVYFKEELYTPVMLANAKYSLEACEKDAILFTNGDNDTFPLEYLQAVKDYRTDVTILNLSMLNLSAIIQQASKGRGKSRPVKLSYPVSRYSEDASEYFQEENVDPFDLTFEKFLSKSYKQTPTSGNSYYNYPESTIEFSADHKLFPEFPDSVAGITSRIKINNTYLTRSDFAVLDILLSNVNERPVYFMETSGEPTLNISDYLFDEGLVKRFIPFKMKNGNTTTVIGNIIAGKSYTNLMNIPVQLYPKQDAEIDPLFVTNFRVQFFLLADFYAEEDPSRAIKLLDRCDSLFPADRWGYETVWAYGIDAYYKSGKETKADSIALKMIKNFDEKLKKKTGGPDESEKTQMIRAVEMIKENAVTYKRENVQKTAELFLLHHPLK
jgi:hypothetical protein